MIRLSGLKGFALEKDIPVKVSLSGLANVEFVRERLDTLQYNVIFVSSGDFALA